MIRPKANSFTLVEMIGAMAILAILASVLAPSVVRQIQTATSVGEDANLADIAQALTNGIRATGIIPNPNLNPTNTNANGFGWAYLASNYTRLAGSKLVSVFPGMTNETGRRLYLSTNLVALASQGGFANTVSNWGATLFPTNAKMYLVSASRPEFNLLLATNGAGAQTNDNSYASAAVNSLDSWVKQFSTNGVTVAPANIVDPSWTNRGEFLHVRTIDLAPIFSEVKAAQQKAIEQEDKNLEEIARALVASIQATGTIPNPAISASAGWVAQVAGYSSMGANAIQYSFPANSIGERRLYLDLSLNPYVGVPLPGGWNALPGVPASAYLVSCSKSDDSFLNTSTTNGGTALSGPALNFLRTWQKTPNSSGVIAANNTEIVPAAWANRGEFLHVRSIDLRSLFCRVTLIDTAAPENVAGFTSVLGNGYAPNSAIAVNVSNNVITFASDGAGNLPVQTASSSQIAGYNSRHGLIAATAIPPGTAKYTGPTSPPAPSYDLIGNVGPGAGSFAVNQTQTFYVLKGQSINLFDGANALNRSVIIQSDVQYKYFNNTWIPVD